MHLHSFLVSSLFVCAGAGTIAQTGAAPACADLHLVPAVRECTSAPFRDLHKILIGQKGVMISSEKATHEAAESAVGDLTDALESRDVKVAKSEAPVVIGFFLADSNSVRLSLQRDKIEF